MRDAQERLKQVDEDFVFSEKKKPFENNITTYYPRFHVDFELAGWFLSVKTKTDDSNSSISAARQIYEAA